MIPRISTSVAEGIVNEETISVNDKSAKNGPWVEEIHPKYILFLPIHELENQQNNQIYIVSLGF